MAEYDLINGTSNVCEQRNLQETSGIQTNEASDEDYQCPICLQLLIEPVVMPCKHELCKLCFTQNVQEANLQCPICRVRISSWARKQARNGTLICRERWELIQKLFPEKCKRRIAGEDDDNDDYYVRRPLKRVLSENGAIRSEYEEEMKKIRKAREEEMRASEELIHRLMKEEEIIDNHTQLMIDNDEELARKLQQQIRSPTQTTPNSKTALNKGKTKNKVVHGSHTLDKWFSPTSKLSTNQNNHSTISTTHSTTSSHDVHNLRQKQEEEDYALAMKLQNQFDMERTNRNNVNRKKGTVDGYLLRQTSSSS